MEPQRSSGRAIIPSGGDSIELDHLQCVCGADSPSPLHINRFGERVYTNRVEFMPVGQLKGWRNARGYPREHDEVSVGLIMVAREGRWADYAIPPVPVAADNFFPDGNHRVNSASRCGRDTLIPMIRSTPENLYPDQTELWLEPGMTRRYALVEHVMVDRHAKKIEIIRAPDLLDRSLEELLATVQETETVDVGFLKTHERVTPNGIFDIGKELKVILHFTFADRGVSSPGQSGSFLSHDVTLEGLEAKYDSWVEFLASGRSSHPFGLRSTIREICSFQGTCDELSLTIRVKP